MEIRAYSAKIQIIRIKIAQYFACIAVWSWIRSNNNIDKKYSKIQISIFSTTYNIIMLT